VPLERTAKVASKEAGHPLEVLHPVRLVQSIPALEAFDQLRIDDLPARLQLQDVTGEIIPRRELDDREDDHRDDRQRDRHVEKPAYDVGYHVSTTPNACAGRPPT